MKAKFMFFLICVAAVTLTACEQYPYGYWSPYSYGGGYAHPYGGYALPYGYYAYPYYGYAYPYGGYRYGYGGYGYPYGGYWGYGGDSGIWDYGPHTPRPFYPRGPWGGVVRPPQSSSLLPSRPLGGPRGSGAPGRPGRTMKR